MRLGMLTLCCSLASLVGLATGSARAQLPAADEPVASEPDELEQRLDLMRTVASGVAVEASVAGRYRPAPLVKQPALRFNDLARDHQDGTLWLYGSGGRPAAIMELWSNDIRQAEWFHSISSTSTSLLRATVDGRVRWVPQQAGVAFQPIEDAVPAERSAVRLRQVKALARRFSAYEIFRGERSELRLLAKPLYEYRDPAHGVLDGSVFLFTHGTNPELLLLLEAVEGDEGLQWQFAFAPSGSAAFHGLLDEREVWKLPEAANVTGAATDPYWLFPRTVAPADDAS